MILGGISVPLDDLCVGTRVWPGAQAGRTARVRQSIREDKVLPVRERSLAEAGRQ